MTIYYVRTPANGGNDGTGTGATGAPWATITKALASVAAGDTVKVGDGTYPENTAGYKALKIFQVFASLVTIESESGAPGGVIVTNSAAGSYPVVYFRGGGSAFIKFKNITFTGGNDTCFLQFYPGENHDNITFEACTFNAQDGATYGIKVINSSGILTNISFINCTINKPSASGTGYSAVYILLSGTASMSGWNFTNCIVASSSTSVGCSCYYLTKVNDLTINGGTITADGTNNSCITVVGSSTNIALLGITANSTSAVTVFFDATTGITITNCVITSSAGSTLFLSGTIANVTISGGTLGNVGLVGDTISIANAIMSTLVANGITTATISGCTFLGVDNQTTVRFGIDGDAGGATTTVTLSNCTINHSAVNTGHALIFGHGCLNCVCDNVKIPVAYDYACVVKSCTGTEIKNCDFTGGTSVPGAQGALYFKGGIGSNAHNNILRAADGACFYMLKSAAGALVKPKNCSHTYSKMLATGAAKCLYIGTDATDLDTGNVNDYHQYSAKGSALFGIVRADADVLTLDELKAAWAGYGDGSNDSHSSLYVSNTGDSAGVGDGCDGLLLLFHHRR